MSMQPAQTPGESQQETASGSSTTAVNWEERYKGSSRTINDLTSTIQTLRDQLSALTSEKEQAKQQLTLKDVEKDAAVGEHSRRLTEALTKISQMELELKTLRAFKIKVDSMKKLNAPHLLSILDSIPALDTPEAQELVMKDFANWGDQIAKSREAQLTSGLTPAAGPAALKTGPATDKEFETAFNNETDPVKRDEIWNAWFQMGMNSNK